MYWRNSDFQIVYFILGKCHTIDEMYRVALELEHDRRTAIEGALAAGATQSPEFRQAEREVEFIGKLVERLRNHPDRKHRHLPDHEAHQACQREEWKLCLIHRAKTFIMTTGSIPQDHLETMMTHPDWKSAIVPAIKWAEANKSIDNLPVMPNLLGGPDGL